jgi:hypothetical protein
MEIVEQMAGLPAVLVGVAAADHDQPCHDIQRYSWPMLSILINTLCLESASTILSNTTRLKFHALQRPAGASTEQHDDAPWPPRR